MGYIYILKNNSYVNYVLKIGKTTKSPFIRAKQLYWGATGVPEHFNVFFACEVPDCDAIEKKIHHKIASYRHNNSREFFHLPIDVAIKITIGCCQELFGRDNFNIVYNEKNVTPNDTEFNNDIDLVTLTTSQLYSLKSSPVNTTILKIEQEERIAILRDIFLEVYPSKLSEWKNNFSKDRNPEKEIIIWEHIAKAFMKISTMQNILTDEFIYEAYGLLLMRSMKSKRNVLKNMPRKYINDKHAKFILDSYELKPQPIIILDLKNQKELGLNIVV